KVVLIRPVSFTFMTAWALGFAVLLAIFFVFGEYTRKARVAGVLAPREGVAKIVAQQAGIVEAVHVKEGAHVRKDEPMIVLGDGRAARGSIGLGAAVISHLDDRKRSLMEQRGFAIAAGNAEQASFAERRTGLVHEAGQLEGEIATQRMRLGLAGQGVDRANRLEDIGFLSTAALDRERDAALDQQSRLEQLQRARSTLLRDLASLEFEAAGARSRGQAQVSAIDMQRASLEQERVERESQFHAAIVAPTAGTVATVLVEPGQMVVAGTPLVALVPSNSTLEALLYAPSRSIGFVHEGEDVLLRYLAYPHQKFGVHRATIVAVSRNPMLPGELGFTPLDGTREPLYRIKATLDSQAIHAYDRLERLQPGMQFEADIILDRRRLIEWIFEPLLGLAGRT
ncbi:MAG TPA: HlyD family efflux transporter periplasmic adaptor subunit, partial [Usitatibacter sp.]